MLKPSDIDTNSLPYTQAQLDALELQFDSAIAKANQSGQWPALVVNYRDGMPNEAINEMCRRYAELGWVATPGRGSVRAQIIRK